MRVLVTGAGGMLGQDVVGTARERGHEVTALTRSDLDVTDGAAVARTIRDVGPEVVVNCAAWTDVDGAEADEEEATKVNGEGAGNVARATAEAGAVLVHLSSDYVFDGNGRAPYVESDPVKPLSAYGRSKLAGERQVADAGSRHAIVRSSWLFGLGGGNFVETMLRLGAEQDELRVVNDQIGCPTFTAHLAEGLLDLAGGQALGIHHAAGAGACSWHAFAIEIFRQAGIEVRVDPTTTAQLERPAPRPPYSVLATARDDGVALPEWREGLADYLAARAGLPEGGSVR
ncbi:MAG: dTDP-4-dehydrorhamnose reductase [Solirubrobacteraceae bacterium]